MTLENEIFQMYIGIQSLTNVAFNSVMNMKGHIHT